MSQYEDKLTQLFFGGVDEIIAKRLQDLHFDKTIRAKIVNVDEAEKGHYKVDDGNATFDAYSDFTKYPLETWVNVHIPRGDYNEQKTILGKYVSGGTEYYTYVKPSETFINLTGNLLGDENLYDWENMEFYEDKLYELQSKITAILTDESLSLQEKRELLEAFEQQNYKIENYEDNECGLVANGDIIEKQIVDINRSYTDYNRLVIKGDFRSWLDSFKLTEGNYGLKITVYSTEQLTSQGEPIETKTNFYLDSSDMFGNPYNYETFVSQEKIFDISGLITITRIQVFLYQENNFKSLDKNLDYNGMTDIPDNIVLKNLYIALGDDLSLYEEDTVKLFTMQSKTYANELTEENKVKIDNNPDDYTRYLNYLNQKTISLRWVHKNEELEVETDLDEANDVSYLGKQTFKSIQSISQLPDGVTIHWYKYVLNSEIEDELAGAFWQEFTPTSLFSHTFSPDIMQPFERYKVIIEYPNNEYIENAIATSAEIKKIKNSLKTLDIDTPEYEKALALIEQREENIRNLKQYYYSDIIQFDAENPVYDYELISLVKGLELEVDAAGQNGVYQIYNEDGSINNPSAANDKRIITATYTSLITGEQAYDVAEEIEWIIPLTNTMITHPQEGIEYDLETDDYREANGYAYISRLGAISTHEPGSEEVDNTQQIFRIAPYYSSNLVNNTITCRITRKGVPVEAKANLIFGTTGVNGTEYTLTLEIEGTIAAGTRGEELRVIPHLYDYEQNEITDLYDASKYSYSWQTCYDTDARRDGVSIRKDGRDAILTFSGTMEQCAHHVLKCSVQTDITKYGTSRNLKLFANLPIPVRNNNLISEYDGPSKICYDSSGTNAKYYQNPFKLYQYNGIQGITEEIDDITWMMLYGADTNEPEDDANYELWEKYYPHVDSESGLLTVPGMFMQDVGKQISVGAYRYGVLIFVQPLYIYQYAYGSPTLNAWDGNLTFDEENGIILSTMMGAGKKNEHNQFEGVLMGDVSAAGSAEATGELKSYYSGMGLYGYHEGVKSFGLNINGKAFFGKAGHGQILIDGNTGVIQSANFKTNTQGMKIDLDKGILTAKKGQAGVLIDPTAANNNPYFKITSATNKNLFYCGVNNYYMQTNDYDRAAEKGLFFNLTDGSMEAYKFTLKAGGTAYGGKITIDSTANASSGYPFAIRPTNSDGTISTNLGFSIKWDGQINVAGEKFKVTSAGKMTAQDADIRGKITAESGKIASFYIRDNALYTSTTLAPSSKTLAQLQANDEWSKHSGVFLSDFGIGCGSQLMNGHLPFYVTKTGALHASLGRIGAWYIIGTGHTNARPGIYSYNPTDGGTDTGVALLQQGTSDKPDVRIFVGKTEAGTPTYWIWDTTKNPAKYVSVDKSTYDKDTNTDYGKYTTYVYKSTGAFVVDKNGNVEAHNAHLYNAEITGTIKGGTIDGATIKGGTISGASIKASGYVTCNGLKVGGKTIGKYTANIFNNITKVRVSTGWSGDYNYNVVTGCKKKKFSELNDNSEVVVAVDIGFVNVDYSSKHAEFTYMGTTDVTVASA